jgi:hypothetical protein
MIIMGMAFVITIGKKRFEIVARQFGNQCQFGNQ